MAADYTVDAIRSTQQIGANGQLVDYVEASFTTVPENATGTVSVPKVGDWSAALTAAIQADVASLKSVFAG